PRAANDLFPIHSLGYPSALSWRSRAHGALPFHADGAVGVEDASVGSKTVDSAASTAHEVTSLDDCYFYHTMELPGHGLVRGEWDLRGREAAYLGHVPLAGRRVLEVGTASGHLCFAMEKSGADVVAYDLSEHDEWDIVPYAGLDVARHVRERQEHIRRL